MRISTSQIYDSATLNLQRNQTSLYKLQNQLSTGRRVLTPEDDPVAAAQALIVTQSREVNTQHTTNQGNAKSQLGLVDSQLNSLVDLLQSVRDRMIQAGNSATMTNTDRAVIATELESRLSEMLGIANAQNGSGDYLFSGYRGATLPFAINGASGSYAYSGDDGERLLQVSSSRQLAVNVAGSDLFMNAKAGNGSFVAAAGGNADVSYSGTATVGGVTVINHADWNSAQANRSAGQPLVKVTFEDDGSGGINYNIVDPATGVITGPQAYVSGTPIALATTGAQGVNFGAQITVNGSPVDGEEIQIDSRTNQGTATIDVGSVIDSQKWATAVNTTPAIAPWAVEFSQATPADPVTYNITDNAGNPVGGGSYTSGQAIALKTAGEVFAQVVISGQPKDGDTFTIKPSTSQSLFQTAQNVIDLLRTPLGTPALSSTEFTNRLGAELKNIDQGLDNVSRVQTNVGTRLRELDSLSDTSSDLNLQYESTLSGLQDLDWAKAISDFTLQKTYLEAAQQSFAQISGLSLFNYL